MFKSFKMFKDPAWSMCSKSLIKIINHSSLSPLNHSITQSLKHSNTQTLNYSLTSKISSSLTLLRPQRLNRPNPHCALRRNHSDNQTEQNHHRHCRENLTVIDGRVIEWKRILVFCKETHDHQQ